MNPLRLAAALALAAGPTLAQSGTWTKQHPDELPALLDVEMVSALDGWAVGLDGTLVRTTNGGVDWLESSLPSAALRGLDREGASGWAVGEGVFRTTDFGQSWTKTSALEGLNDVDFADASFGLAVDDAGRVHRSVDGGQSWSAQVVAAGALSALAVVDASRAYAVGDAGAALTTADGGLSWTSLATGTTADLSDVHFATPSRGWAAAGDRVLRTDDAGQSWVEQPMPGGAIVTRLSFQGPDWGWGVGPAGDIVRTVNGGEGWNVKFAAGTALFDVAMGDQQNGLAVGAAGSVLRTTDRGKTWTLVHGGQAAQPPSAYCFDAVDGQHAWAGSDQGNLLRTADGGANWELVFSGSPNTIYYAVDFWDDQRGYAIGEKQAFYPTTAWTSDGGQNWNVTNHLGMYEMGDVDAIGPLTAVVCTSSYIWRTTDGGQNWDFILTIPSSTYRAADFLDAQVGWIVGTKIFKTTDGGLSWTFLHDPSADLYDVAFADALHGWAVGLNGAILRTTDGGATWTQQDAGAPHLTDVEATSPNEAWIVGLDGFVARTLDGGATWTPATPPGGETTQFYGARFLDTDDGWVAGGWEAGIWRREPTGADCSWSSYCTAAPNSVGPGALMGASGTTSMAANDLVLAATGCPPGQFGLFFYGPQQASTPVADGVLCVGGKIVRLPAIPTDAGGGASFALDLSALPPAGPIQAGETWNFQLWYRDPSGGPAGSNFSDGLAVRFCD